MNIEFLRSETPGCRSKIHFNNAGCSLHPLPVVTAVKNYLEEESLIGGYEYAALKAEHLNTFYTSTAKLFNCKPQNIAFTTSSTDSYIKALSSIPFKNGDVILTTLNDYVSNQIQFLSLQKRFGVEIIRAENIESGEVDVNSIHELIKKHRPILVAVTHVPNNTGMIQPVEGIGDICAAEDIIYIVDACQSAGQINVDTTKIKCDFLAAASRKFMRGPRGGGILFVSDKMLSRTIEPMFIDMRGADWVDDNMYQPVADAKKFELTEMSYAIQTGVIAAVNYILNIGIDNIAERNKIICSYARNKLAAIPSVRLLDQGKNLSAIISLTTDNYNVFKLKDELIKRNINVGAAAKKFALMDFNQKHVEAALRVSPHYYNTLEEIDVLVESISEVISQ